MKLHQFLSIMLQIDMISLDLSLHDLIHKESRKCHSINHTIIAQSNSLDTVPRLAVKKLSTDLSGGCITPAKKWSANNILSFRVYLVTLLKAIVRGRFFFSIFCEFKRKKQQQYKRYLTAAG